VKGLSVKAFSPAMSVFESIIIFPMMQFSPMPVGRLAEPFNHPDWIFEIKWDGFRSLAFIENGRAG
jgi:ATP-dependent DNA ligase